MKSIYICTGFCCCCCWVTAVVSDSVRPHRRQPTRLPVPGILQARILEQVAISFSNAWKWKWSRSVMSDSFRPHGLQPTRLLRPWFPRQEYCYSHINWHVQLCRSDFSPGVQIFFLISLQRVHNLNMQILPEAKWPNMWTIRKKL